jgi:hypothetical protein
MYLERLPIGILPMLSAVERGMDGRDEYLFFRLLEHLFYQNEYDYSRLGFIRVVK